MGLFTKNKEITPEKRRENSNKKIKKMGIACYETLPMIESSQDVTLKSAEIVIDRAIITLKIAMTACLIGDGQDVNHCIQYCLHSLSELGLVNQLLPKERNLLKGKANQQDIIDLAWGYERYWTLLWAMDLITDKEMEPMGICNVERANTIYELTGIKEIAKLRNKEKILDMLDLFYRYHWACVEKQIKPETSIGKLNSEVVMERRRALEWLVSDIEDWEDIELHT